MENIKQEIKTKFNDFGTSEYNAMTIMENTIEDSNIHYKVEDIQNVYKDLKNQKNSIISEIKSKLNGSYILTPASLNEQGEEIPATYYEVGTMESFISDLSSTEDWSAEEVFNELKGDSTWEEFKGEL